jgi:hypothetical protein
MYNDFAIYSFLTHQQSSTIINNHQPSSAQLNTAKSLLDPPPHQGGSGVVISRLKNK